MNATTMDRIVEAGFCRLERPLRAPYRLSFATLHTFDSVLLYMASEDGGIGFGEAVALPGYSWEVTEEIVESVRRLLPTVFDMQPEDFSKACRELFPRRPFAASALQSCIDTIHQPVELGSNVALSVNYPVASETDDAGLTDALEDAAARGYGYIKVKVGKDIQRDVKALRTLLHHPQSDRLRFSFDANQAFSPRDAHEFCAALEEHGSGNVLWLEQPFAKDDWARTRSLIDSVSTPVMLDESIYDSTDVHRAADVGAAGVKLKIFKNLGPLSCTALAEQAGRLGLTVVIGNGVATEVGNFLELATVAHSPSFFSDPAECNGFSKTVEPLCGTPVLSEHNGQIRISGADVTARRLGECVRETVTARGEVFRAAPLST